MDDDETRCPQAIAFLTSSVITIEYENAFLHTCFDYEIVTCKLVK